MDNPGERLLSTEEKKQRRKEKLREYQKKWRNKVKQKAAGNDRNAIEMIHKLQKDSAERMQKHRNKKKMAKDVNFLLGADEVSAFSTKQVKGKCMRRVQMSLPKSLAQRQEILLAVCALNGLKMKRDESFTSKFRTFRSEQQRMIIKLVHDFYMRDSISHKMPGRKDNKVVKIDGKRQTVQVSYMLMATKEAYELFMEAHPAVEVSLRCFQLYRPKNVLLKRQTPQNICVCPYHSNVRFLCEAVVRVCPDFPSSPKSLLAKLCCNVEDEACMTNKCPECLLDDKVIEPEEFMLRTKEGSAVDYDFTAMVNWLQWQKTASTSGAIITQKCRETGTFNDLVKELIRLINAFKLHDFTKRKQAAAFQDALEMAEKPNSKVVVVQVDFSENYRCEEQDTDMASYFGYSQISLFTACAWGGHPKPLTFAFISDYLKHDTASVRNFMRQILTRVKQVFINTEIVKIFSDGATSQFKNRFNFYTLQNYELVANTKVEWHFFATSHGKGAVDGIGGTIKRIVREQVLSNQAIVHNAAEFKLAIPENCSIEVFHVAKDELVAQEIRCRKEWEKLKVSIGGRTKWAHFIKPSTTKNCITLRDYSTQESYREAQLTKDQNNTYEFVEGDQQDQQYLDEVWSDNEEGETDFEDVDDEDGDEDEYVLEANSKDDEENVIDEHLEGDNLQDNDEQLLKNGSPIKDKEENLMALQESADKQPELTSDSDADDVPLVQMAKHSKKTETILDAPGYFIWNHARNRHCVVEIGDVRKDPASAISYCKVSKLDNLTFKPWAPMEKVTHSKIVARLAEPVSQDSWKMVFPESEEGKLKKCS